MKYKELAEMANDRINAAIEQHYMTTGHLPRVITVRSNARMDADSIVVSAVDTWGDDPVGQRIDEIKRIDDTDTAWVLIIGRRWVVRRGGVALRRPA